MMSTWTEKYTARTHARTKKNSWISHLSHCQICAGAPASTIQMKTITIIMAHLETIKSKRQKATKKNRIINFSRMFTQYTIYSFGLSHAHHTTLATVPARSMYCIEVITHTYHRGACTRISINKIKKKIK